MDDLDKNELMKEVILLFRSANASPKEGIEVLTSLLASVVVETGLSGFTASAGDVEITLNHTQSTHLDS